MTSHEILIGTIDELKYRAQQAAQRQQALAQRIKENELSENVLMWRIQQADWDGQATAYRIAVKLLEMAMEETGE